MQTRQAQATRPRSFEAFLTIGVPGSRHDSIWHDEDMSFEFESVRMDAPWRSRVLLRPRCIMKTPPRGRERFATHLPLFILNSEAFFRIRAQAARS